MSKKLNIGTLGTIFAALAKENKRLMTERDDLANFIQNNLDVAAQDAPQAMPMHDEPRPDVHPKAIIKLVDGRTDFQDIRAAVVVRFVKNNPGATIGQIAHETGYAIDEARYLVKSMRAQEIIRSEGNRRGTRYYMWEDQSGAIHAPTKATGDEPPKRRGRPPGSKNKPKTADETENSEETASQKKNHN